MPHGYVDDKQALTARLSRIEGQVRGLKKMIDEDRYCIDILTQVSSVNRALQGVAMKLLDDHVKHCVADAISSGDGGNEKIDEAMSAIERLVRS